MATNALGFLEGQAINRPPLLVGSNYPYWKCKMRIFIKVQNRLLWNVVENGPYEIRNKEENDYNDDDWKKLDMNEIAMNILYCGMNENDLIGCALVGPQNKYGMNLKKHMKEHLE